MVVPLQHLDSYAALSPEAAQEMTALT